LVKDQSIFPKVIILLILITLSLDDVLMLLGEDWCWSILELKGLRGEGGWIERPKFEGFLSTTITFLYKSQGKTFCFAKKKLKPSCILRLFVLYKILLGMKVKTIGAGLQGKWTQRQWTRQVLDCSFILMHLKMWKFLSATRFVPCLQYNVWQPLVCRLQCNPPHRNPKQEKGKKGS